MVSGAEGWSDMRSDERFSSDIPECQASSFCHIGDLHLGEAAFAQLAKPDAEAEAAEARGESGKYAEICGRRSSLARSKRYKRSLKKSLVSSIA